MVTTQARYARPSTGGGLARRTALGVGVAVLAVLIAQGLVTLLGLNVGETGAMTPFATAPLVASSVLAGAGAALTYAGLVRFTERPVRNFVAAAGAVFALMLVPVVAFAPSLGVTAVGQAVLVAYHVLVAVPIVAALIGVGSR
jgi:hypothetical protein